ncbi:hypothetical protein HPB51_025113 [Rhipicephalus microplus]|uniref:Uncharacterized protein n=1 Tax=Rhipicephalus microplus TaxID=6941 RepID=A0A9J6DRA6_RHIMP|nr:hypothetical protein HPB51_025113 [Rhipicephalus microplus]
MSPARHRSDVYISDHVRGRGGGMTAPPEDHACEPKCKLCGKGHLTADGKCKEAFRTPYTYRRDIGRPGGAWKEKSGRRKTPIHKRAERKRSKNGPGAGRSIGVGQEEEAGSFPRLPKRQEGELPPMTGQVNERTSGSGVLNSGRPTSPNRKVGGGERASQDKRDEEMLTIKEENRMLEEQLSNDESAK